MFPGSVFPALKGLRRHAALAVLLCVSFSSLSCHAADSDWLVAREAFRKGDDAGLQAATRAMAGSPLAVYGEFWQLWRRLKDAPAADVRAFLDREQGGYLAEKLRAEWLRQLAKRQDWALFRAEYPKLIDTGDTELQCLRLQADLASGDSSGLGAAKAALWMTAKDQVAACTPALDAMQARGVVTEEDRWLRLRLALDANAGGLARFLLTGLGTSLSAAQLKSLQDAPAAFIASADLSQRAGRELAAYAYGRWARLDYKAARAQLEAQADSLREQAPVAWRQMATAAARVFDPEAESLFARSDTAWWPDSQRELRLRLLVRQGDWAGYLKQYEQLPVALKTSRAWQYWQARALQEQGAAVAARKLFAQLTGDEDYYGLLAREAQGGALGALPRARAADDPDRERLARNAGFQRAFALYGLGQRWESASEWNWAVRTADDRLLLAAAERANQLGWYDRAIYAAERVEVREPRLLYLAPYRDVARGPLQDTGLDEGWVYGLMRQESRFAPAARSSSGAGGLMQLMPGTAQWSSNKLGLPWQPDSVNDVGQNLKLGTFYLNHVLTELGHPVLATAGYNAGPRRALEWQPAQPLDATRFVESIPFAETRDYVKKVMTNAVHYARVFGQGETRLTARLGVIPAKAAAPVIEGP